MVLPQLGIPDFVDSPRRALNSSKKWMGCGMGQVEEWGKGREGKLGLVCKNKIQSEVTSITVLGKVQFWTLSNSIKKKFTNLWQQEGSAGESTCHANLKM